MAPQSTTKAELKVAKDTVSFVRAAVDEIVRCAKEALSARGRFTFALSGGNTPAPIYSLLAQENKDSLPWDKIFIFFGDERHVPPDHPESNYRMANEALLSQVPLPNENIFRIRAELDAGEAAQQYERTLTDFFQLKSNERPRLDLIHLGMGEEGHTASLFPGSPALQEKSRLVAANWVEKLKSQRITFTYPVLNNAREVVLIVAGASKAPVLRDIFCGSADEKYPVQGVQPAEGRLLWIVAPDAGSML